ncbi:WAT1-related protein [Vitis vinifera]|uniref:WAT1-related protein n=1 Tax=Vitis vinifera TaxID=29760 RepID=A0A438JNM3_VITVI|nr:WAT1-related protein [Vitis vinifera]
MGVMGTVSLPFLGMVIVVFTQVTNMIVSKMAMSNGLSSFVLVLYSNAISAVILLPFPFSSTGLYLFLSPRPPLTFSILCRFFLLALIGCFAQIFGYAGVQYSSPTLGSAMLNLVPAFTFILAVICRMEKLELKKSSSLAKSVGALVSVAGAFVVTFYKGPPIMFSPSFSDSSNQIFSSQSHWVLGDFFLLMNLCWLQCEQDPSAWRLKLDVGLLAVLYSAIVGNVIRISMCTWCVRRAGPLFCSMFKPLGIVFAFVMGVIFSGDALHLGSLVGAIIIVSGFYAVMWGKAKEAEEGRLECSRKVPLLQNQTDVSV